MITYLGYCKGETCNLEGCQGIIDEKDSDYSCSCHISAPCSYCETSREYCPECDWDGREEQLSYYQSLKPSPEQQARYDEENRKIREQDEIFYKKFRGEMLIEKLEYKSKCYYNSSMIKEGFYPPHMTKQEVEKEIRGTFGGRFEYFSDRNFKYIAYTD